MHTNKLAIALTVLIAGCNVTNCKGLSDPGPIDSGVTASGDVLDASRKEIEWLNMEVAEVMAAQSGKPLLVFFHASWCMYCSEMRDRVWQDSEIISIVNDGYVAASVDIDTRDDLVERFKIKGVPRVLIIDDGDVELRLKGYVDNLEYYRDHLRR